MEHEQRPNREPGFLLHTSLSSGAGDKVGFCLPAKHEANHGTAPLASRARVQDARAATSTSPPAGSSAAAQDPTTANSRADSLPNRGPWVKQLPARKRASRVHATRNWHARRPTGRNPPAGEGRPWNRPGSSPDRYNPKWEWSGKQPLRQRQIGEQQSRCLPLATEPNAARNEFSGWAWLVPEGRQPHESIWRPALPCPACSPHSANAGCCLETGCRSRNQRLKMPQPPLALRVAPDPTHGTTRIPSRHISSAHTP